MPSNKKKQSSTLPPMLSNETVKLHSPRRARGSSSVVPGRGQAALAGATASETSPDFTCHILAAASPLLPRLAALPFKLAIALPGPSCNDVTEMPERNPYPKESTTLGTA